MRDYKYLTIGDRKKIETLYAEGARPCDIAEKIGSTVATVYRELQRGETGELNSNFRPAYNAEVAETRVNQSLKNRGRRKAEKGEG